MSEEQPSVACYIFLCIENDKEKSLIYCVVLLFLPLCCFLDPPQVYAVKYTVTVWTHRIGAFIKTSAKARKNDELKMIPGFNQQKDIPVR